MHWAADRAIAAIAVRQHGNVTHDQLLKLGLSARQIEYRVKIGRIFRVHRGVYAVGRPPQRAIERAAAAVLACGAGAALSHQSALALWGLGKWPWVTHVIVPRNRRPREGIKVHQPNPLLPRDLRTHNNIRVTSPARTLLDCAPTLTTKTLTRAVNDSRRTLRLRPHQLKDIAERNPRHPGTSRLKPFLDLKGGPTRSEWEDAFPEFCKRHGLPEPTMSVTVAGHEVDALFPHHRLIVELDSWQFHQTRTSFEHDRDRDADTLAAGHATVRLTWERMHERPRREADRLQTILLERADPP